MCNICSRSPIPQSPIYCPRNNDIMHVEIPEGSPLENWRTLLSNWTCCYKKWAVESETVPGEHCPELTNTGILAAAAWKSAWIAFHECNVLRPNLNNDMVPGRCDLWLRTNDCGIEDWVECKGAYGANIWRVDSWRNADLILQRAIQVAKAIATAAGAAPGHYLAAINGRIIAVAFCNLSLPNVQNLNDVEELVESLIHNIRTNVKHDAMAWCLPILPKQVPHPKTPWQTDKLRLYGNSLNGGGYNIMPGVALLAKVVRP